MENKELTIEITDNCSLDCIQCSTQAGTEGATYMSVEDVKKYLAKFPDFDVIRISGGEPFQHPNLIEILRTVKEAGRKAILLSCGIKNGNPLNDSIQEIKPYVNEIIFSMHGEEIIHGNIVTNNRYFKESSYGVPDCFVPKKGLEDLPNYFEMLRNTVNATIIAEIPFSFETVLMNSNYNDLEEIAEELKYTYGEGYDLANWHILRFVKQGRGKQHTIEILSEEQIEDFLEQVPELRKKYGLNITYSNSFEGKHCDCGTAKAVVMYNGTIIECSALKDGGSGKFACNDRI